MALRHVIEGLMAATQSSYAVKLHFATGLSEECISRIRNGMQQDILFKSIAEAQRQSGVSGDQIFAWFRLPITANLRPSELLTMGFENEEMD